MLVRTRPILGLAMLLGVALSFPVLQTGCAGGGAETASTPQASALPRELVQRAWPVEMATDEAQNALIAKSRGWLSLTMKRDLPAAASELGQAGGLAAARGHLEAAAMYRQASLLVAWSFIETYGKTPVETDPVGCAHLLAVSYAIVGDLEKARAESKKLDGVEDVTTAWHAPWKAWLAQPSPVWPPDLASLPLEIGAPTVGGWPQVTAFPSYKLPERAGATTEVEMADPGVLVALASWHAAAGRSAAGADVVQFDTALARYRLPVEPEVAAPVALGQEMTFGSDFLVPEDGPFIAAVTGKAGVDAVDAWKDKSLIAALAASSRGEDGKISTEKAIDRSAELRAEVLALAKQKTNATENTTAQRLFADLARLSVLRNLALVAEAEGNREASGVLRINALERSEDASTRDPNALLSLAAWDASNRYPARASDFVHELAGRYPTLEAARFGLNVLALRVSRERVEPPPG